MTLIANPITSVTVNGAALDLANVVWDVQVTHGRTDIASTPTPGTARLTLILDPADPIPVDVADDLVIEAYSTPRFTGKVVTLDLVHVDTAVGIDGPRLVTVYAIGNLALLDTMTDGASGYIEQTFVDRATAILATTGLTYAISNDDGTTLLAEAAGDVRTVRDLLGTLCETVGATLADLPDGTILLETYTRRATNYSGDSWGTATGAWSANTQAWQTGRIILELPNSSVRWAPTWRNRLDIVINDVSISYGSSTPQAIATDSDAGSIATYGTRSAHLDTKIKNLADASARAAAILTAQATSRWNLPEVTVLVDTLDATTRDAVLNLESGDRILLTDLPAGAPDSPFLGVVEGWTEQMQATGHTITLHLSDPRFSFAMAAWGDIAGALTWAGVNTARSWSDIVLASNIT